MNLGLAIKKLGGYRASTECFGVVFRHPFVDNRLAAKAWYGESPRLASLIKKRLQNVLISHQGQIGLISRFSSRLQTGGISTNDIEKPKPNTRSILSSHRINWRDKARWETFHRDSSSTRQ